MKLPIAGVIPPIVTPLIDDFTIDEKGLENLVEHLIRGGIHGVFLLGTTGEATNLSLRLRKKFIKAACALINKRVPILVGLSSNNIEEAIEIAEISKYNGADAVVINAPYYLQIEQFEFIKYLQDLTPHLSLPFLLYNIPSCTKFNMSIDTIKKAQELGAIGIKDSSGDMAFFNSVIEEFKDTPEFSIIIGSEQFLNETILNGGHGTVAGGANIFPHLFVELYEASVKRDLGNIEELRRDVIKIEKYIYNTSEYSSRHIKTIKSALAAMDICDNYVAHPFSKNSMQEYEIIKQNIYLHFNSYIAKHNLSL